MLDILTAMLRKGPSLACLSVAESRTVWHHSGPLCLQVERFRGFFLQKAPFAVEGGDLRLENVSVRLL